MSVKLFVGNLPNDCRRDDLENLFSQYGQVTECSVMGNYGFVHMSGESEAQAALNDLNNFTLMGNALCVELSKPGAGKKPGKGIPDRTGLTKIFIGNIKDGTPSEDLKSLFETYGEVAESDVCGSFGFIHMKDHGNALKAIKSLKGYLLNGNKLNIELSTRSTQGRSKSGSSTDFRYDDYPSPPYGRSNFQGRVLRGRGSAPPRFDPYKTGGPRRPLLDDYSNPSMYQQQSRPPLLPSIPAPGASDSFARELLELYLKNPVAFDRYARDPLVQQSLNLSSEEDPQNVDPYYRPPREYYEKKQFPNDNIETMPVTYPNIPMPGLSRGAPGVGMRHTLPYPPANGPRLQRMPGSGNGSHLYTSFE